MSIGEEGKKIDLVIAIVSVAMVIYQLAATQYLFFDPILHQNLHYAFGLTLVSLYAIKSANKMWPVWGLVLVLSILATGYVHYNFNNLLLYQGSPTKVGLLIGVILIAVAIITTWKVWGPIVPVICIIFLIYTLTASYWPGPLEGYTITFKRLVNNLSIGLTGIYGNLLGTSANYIFLFLVFGAMMEVSGATKWFNDIGRLAGGVLRGGPAQTAIISSSLVGMISGSAAANVGITGVFTIPLMKKSGLKAEVAGATEASASTGGQITPPVMGAAAFVMADILGVPYVRILAMAALPAVIYYLSLMIEAELRGRKLNLKYSAEGIDWRDFILRAPLFIVPLFSLIYFMARGFSASYSAFVAIMVMLVLAFIRKETRPSLNALVGGFVSGAKTGSEIAVVTAALAAIWVALTGTGLGTKLPLAIEALSQGNILLAIVLVMIVSLILGAGVPTLAAYLLVAITTVPALVRMGIVPEAAHMAAFYFAIFSAVTPPFALAALVASRIAGSEFIPTAIVAMKMSIIGLIFPFLFVYNPMLILINWQWSSGLLFVLLTFLLVLTLAIIKVGYFATRLNKLEYIFAACAIVILFFSITSQHEFLVGVAFISFIMLSVSQFLRCRKQGTLAKAESLSID